MTKALVPLAEGVEEMEAVIMIDVFRRAGWTVDAVAIKAGPVTASRGVILVPDVAWDDIRLEDYDIIALPGGNNGTIHLMNDARLLSALRAHHDAGKWVAAVCAGPLVLQKAGILDGKRVTCHPGAAPQLTRATRVEARVVTDGKIITSQGPGTTFAFALAIVERISGEAKARELARAMVLEEESAPGKIVRFP